MSKLMKSFFSDVVIYGFGNLLKKLSAFILLPILTYYLTPNEYGTLSLILTSVTLFVIVFSSGLDNASTFYYYKTNNNILKGQILYTKLLLRIIITIPLLFICLFSEFFSQVFFHNSAYQLTIILACFLIFIETLISEQKHLYRLINKPKLYNILNIGNAFTYLILTSLFVIVFGLNINGVLMSGVLSGFILFAFSFSTISKSHYDRHFKLSIAKLLFFYGFPLIMVAVTNWLFKWSDKYLIGYFVGLKDVGLYAVANALAQPVIFIILAFQLSYLPFFWKTYNHDTSANKIDSKTFVEKTFKLYFVLICILAMFISVFAKEITSLITNHKYFEAHKALVFIAFAFVLDFAKRILMVGIFIHKKQKYNFLFLLISLIINIALNIYFIPHYGFVGAALTTLISFAINFMLIYFYTQKLFKVDVNIWSIIVFFVSCFLIAYIFTILKMPWNIYISIIFRILSIASCFILALFLEIITINDLTKSFNYFSTIVKSKIIKKK